MTNGLVPTGVYLSPVLAVVLPPAEGVPPVPEVTTEKVAPEDVLADPAAAL
jgi:hypothetical protein